MLFFSLDFFKEPLTHSLREQIHELIKNIKILDLGVGNGAFLVAAGKFLERIHPLLDSMEEAELKLEILEKNLHGVDDSDRAIHSCRRNILAWMGGNNLNQRINKVINEASIHKSNLSAFIRDCLRRQAASMRIY